MVKKEVRQVAEREGYAVVVGGINVDLGGRSEEGIRAGDSNPGRVTMSLGGVGRNIAHNLRLLGIPVFMLTALGTDRNADWARESCRALGIDLSCARTVEGAATSSYLYVQGPEGELSVGICDAAVAEYVTPDYLAGCRELLRGAACVVMDGNIPQESLEYLAESVSCPIFSDPVSVTKGQKLLRVLPKLYAMKPNALEAEALTGIPITDRESLRKAGRAFSGRGVQNVYISCGARGLYALEKEQERFLPNPPAEIRGTNGAGDAMMAGLVAAYMMDLPAASRAPFALGVAAVAMESEETVNPKLSREAALAKAALVKGV